LSAPEHGQGTVQLVGLKDWHIKTQLLLAKEIVQLRELSDEEIMMRRDLKGLCLGLASPEHTIARTRSRITYLREGDANTKFFHLHATYRRRRNHIRALQAEGGRTADPEEMAKILENYYVQLLGNQPSCDMTINFVKLGITPQDLSALDLPFIEEEVWATIKELSLDKSLGMDGMIGAFYKSTWPVIKADIMRVVNSFYAVDRRQFRCLNGALLTLIPKKPDVVAPSDYRPISLIHSFPKMVAKMLANRLASQLDVLVQRNQSVFIKGRSILDNYT
jgi:hypothetical protein